MKFSILFFVLVISLQTMAQENIPPPPPKTLQDDVIKNDYCVLSATYDDRQLLKVFPFNEAGLIKVVSFEVKKPIIDSGQVISIDSSYWKEEFIISKDHYKELSKLMFNFGPSKKFDPGNTWQLDGYQPSYSVIFYNPKNKIIAITELSFKNNKLRTYPSDFGGEKKCSTILGYYREFFNQLGIEVPNYTSNLFNTSSVNCFL
jgi:hypothetical protein